MKVREVNIMKKIVLFSAITLVSIMLTGCTSKKVTSINLQTKHSSVKEDSSTVTSSSLEVFRNKEELQMNATILMNDWRSAYPVLAHSTFVVESADGGNPTKVYMLADQEWWDIDKNAREEIWWKSVQLISNLTDKAPNQAGYPVLEIHATVNGQKNVVVAVQDYKYKNTMNDRYK